MLPFVTIVVVVGVSKLGGGGGGGGGAPALDEGMDEVVIAMVPVDSRRVGNYYMTHMIGEGANHTLVGRVDVLVRCSGRRRWW